MTKEPREPKTSQADVSTDDFPERVTRNEGRLVALEVLVRETRDSDRKLIEQRSDSLAQELERRAESLLELVTARADAVLMLSRTEREADQREYRDGIDAAKTATDEKWIAHTETEKVRINFATDTIVATSESALAANRAEVDSVRALVEGWREAETTARNIQAGEYARRLDVLNHAHERQEAFQARAVTRELFQSEKEAQVQRENVLRDQIVALDRLLLGMSSIASADQAHTALRTRIEEATAAMALTLNTRIGVVEEKVSDLKTYVDKATARSGSYAALYGWIAAGVGIVVGVIVIANFLSTK